MRTVRNTARTVTLGDGGTAAQAVHQYLRDEILSGRFKPGEVLNQLELAPLLGVSATPVREALRMLHEEGLVDAPPQKRARVVGFDPDRVEALYAERMCLEAVGAGMTAAAGDPDAYSAMAEAFARMSELASPEPSSAWHAAHRDFHLATVSALGTTLGDRVAANIDRSARFMRMHTPETTDAWATSTETHAAILRAVEQQDVHGAGAALVADLASAALSLIHYFTPEHPTSIIHAVVEHWSS